MASLKAGNTTWLTWLQNTQQTSGTYVFDVNDPDGIYGFEVLARNNLGQTEPVKQQPDGTVVLDREAPFMEPKMLLPMIIDESTSTP